MQTRGAVAVGVGTKWSVESLELEEPRDREVLVRVTVAGLCHSDQHLLTGDLAQPLPLVGGHEGAGVVERVGKRVTVVRPGDHVALSFMPGCGRCKWCVRGEQFICDNGRDMETGLMLDGTARFRRTDGAGIGAIQRLGTFSNWLIASEEQCIRIDNDIPLEVAAAVSCGVATGWGSAVKVGEVRPNDLVLVLGTGGVGMNAIQGAVQAGARWVVAVDTNRWKRELALQFGASASFDSIAAARQYIGNRTNGQGADVAIVTVGRVDGGLIAEAFRMVRKRGTCVVVSLGQNVPPIDINPQELTVYAKTLRGSVYGYCNPVTDIPDLLAAGAAGKLKLSELITQCFPLDDINETYTMLEQGELLRGMIRHEH